jgi:hypothetical protein
MDSKNSFWTSFTTSSENHAFTHDPKDEARKLRTYRARKSALAAKIASKSLLIASSKKNCKIKGIIMEKAVPRNISRNPKKNKYLCFRRWPRIQVMKFL